VPQLEMQMLDASKRCKGRDRIEIESGGSIQGAWWACKQTMQKTTFDF